MYSSQESWSNLKAFPGDFALQAGLQKIKTKWYLGGRSKYILAHIFVGHRLLLLLIFLHDGVQRTQHRLGPCSKEFIICYSTKRKQQQGYTLLKPSHIHLFGSDAGKGLKGCWHSLSCYCHIALVCYHTCSWTHMYSRVDGMYMSLWVYIAWAANVEIFQAKGWWHS